MINPYYRPINDPEERSNSLDFDSVFELMVILNGSFLESKVILHKKPLSGLISSIYINLNLFTNMGSKY